MLTFTDGISVQQAFDLCTILSVLAFAFAATRLFFLSPRRRYTPFLGLLAIWQIFCVVSLTVPVSSKYYLRIYLVAAPVSWLFYFAVARDLYQKVFAKYPGIAFVGRWSLYLSAILVLAVGLGSVWLSPSHMKSGWQFEATALVDRFVLFGISFFLVLLAFVIIRYPISIQRNLVVHIIVLASILFYQSLSQVVDQWTAYHFSTLWNTLTAALDTVLVTAWAIWVNRAGESVRLTIRHNIQPETELHLLNQLDSLNGILLRAARK